MDVVIVTAETTDVCKSATFDGDAVIAAEVAVLNETDSPTRF